MCPDVHLYDLTLLKGPLSRRHFDPFSVHGTEG